MLTAAMKKIEAKIAKVGLDNILIYLVMTGKLKTDGVYDVLNKTTTVLFPHFYTRKFCGG